MEAAFETLKGTVEKVPPRQRTDRSWISPRTWSLVDTRVALRKQNRMGKAEGRRLTRKIKASLKEDRIARAKATGEACEGALRQGNVQEAFRHLQGWYQAASEVALRPCFLALERQTQDREELYGRVPPPGAPIPININPHPILDSIPTDPEIRDVVQSLRFGQAGGTSKIRAEDIRGWLSGVLVEEDPKLSSADDAGDNWQLFVQLIQSI